MTAPVLIGSALEEAIRLREGEGWSFMRIGKHFGASEAAATNAVIIALCPRKGFRPAQRDQHGAIVPDDLARLREMLRKGMKGIDIMLRLGISASAVSHERRRYNADLRERGKRLLPPPGGGERYSGAKIDKATRAEVERLLQTGLGGPKVAAQTGVSKTHVQRIRAKLIRRLRRKGEALAGCDSSGRRRVMVDHTTHIPQVSIDQLRALILARTPVRRAAAQVGIGLCSAYRIRDALRSELEAEGRTLEAPILPGRVKGSAHPARQAAWLPAGTAAAVRYRRLIRELGDPAEARRVLEQQLEDERRAAREAERARPLSFEEKLARVAAGAKLVAVVPITKAAPDMTLGGIATGAI